MSRQLSSILLFIVVFEIALRFAECGFCTESYSCPSTCYRQKCSSHSCGLFGTSRCNSCSTQWYGCQTTCYRRVCCSGYTGTHCSDPLCFGSIHCPNGGFCQSPGQCLCSPGFSGSRCVDIDECSTGEAKCSQICANTLGSFVCSCREGYLRSYDAKTCDDINECYTDNGGCEHDCTNTDGSFTCSCDEGYDLSPDGLSCKDIDECAADTHQCNQLCQNTVGSYTCDCNDGFTLDMVGFTCYDDNECVSGEHDCEQVCINEAGSYSCTCVAGYIVSTNDTTQCEDINECADDNGGCSDECANSDGSFWCHCPTGYTLNEDERTCKEINECNDGTALCEHVCTKAHQSYVCTCNNGYRLKEDKFSCEDIDECNGVTCYNGGTCIDGVAHYTCRCLSGFTDLQCETDINECDILNAGCEESCTNTAGSYHCGCEEPHKLRDNGFSCSNSNSSQYQSGLTLPIGNFMIDLNGHQKLSSTMKWYRHNSNKNVVYTRGIVHVESGTLTLPLSMTGIQIDVSNINTMSRSVELTEDDGSELVNTRDGAELTELELTQTDIVAFLSSNAFTESYFKGIQAALPDWASLSKDASSAIPIYELSTNIITGDQISTIPSCVGAPVDAGRTYNSFVTTADLVIGLFGENAKISKTTSESKMCILVELTSGFGGTIYFMFPDRFPTELYNLTPFSSINNADSVKFNGIDGFALSTNKGISVNTEHEDNSLSVWNGDHDFNYKLPTEADVWIKADVTIRNDDVDLTVTANLFLSIPNPLNLLTDTFEDKWEIFLAVEKSSGKLFFGGSFDLTFEIEDFILSIGGQDKRTECGANANPAGIFGTITWFDKPVLREKRQLGSELLIVKLLQHTYLSLKAKLFVSAGEYKNTINISSEVFENRIESLLYQIGTCAENLKTLITSTFRNDLGPLLHHADTFTITLDLFQSTYSHLNSPTTLVNRALALTNDLGNILQDITTISASVTDLGDILTNGLGCIQLNINTLAELLLSSTQASSVALTNSISNSNGFGIQVKNSVSLRFTPKIALSLDIAVIEFVSSKQGLGQCGRFHRVYELFKDEEAFRFNIRLIKGIPVGLLFGIPIDIDLSGIGFAVNEDGDKFVLQALFEFFPFLDLYLKYSVKFNVNTFITNNGLYAYREVEFFSYFYIQLDVATEFDDTPLDNLKMHVDGRFVLSEDKDTNSEYTKRDVSHRRERFSNSYLEGIVNLLEEIGEHAKRRVEDVQKRVTAAKTKVNEAQNWLESKKSIVGSAKSKFDKANEFLMDRQKDVENAKDVFETVAGKLKEARDKVNRLCTIRRCRRICIPGLRCRWFSCSWTSCMISFADPICTVKNVLCSIVRRAAFLVYDIAIAALKIPLIALDVANAALWTAQIAVDLAKNGLNLANAALDLAQLGLEGVKIGLDLANAALDLVKIAVDVGLKILNFIVLDGIQNIIDVRNCGFAIDIDRPINPTLDITCEINIFKTGWTNVQIRINFLNPLQSIWQAAKSTFKEIINRINIFSRKKREIRQTYASNIYPLIRKIRQANGTDSSNEYLSSIIDLALPINVNSGENTSSLNSDYDEKVTIYTNKCTVVEQVYRFMITAFSSLTAKCDDLKEKADELETNITELATYTSDMFDGITLEDSGIDASVAVAEFNMTLDEVTAAFAEGLDSIKTNSYVHTLLDMASNTSTMLTEQKYEIEHLPVLTEWASNFNESLAAYFDPEECVDIYDCIHVSIHRLNELFLDEDVDEQAHQIDTIDEIESIFLALLNASDVDIYYVLNASNQITGYLDDLIGAIYFCDEAPVIHSEFENATAVIGRNLMYRCNATGGGVLNYTWYKNNAVVSSEANAILSLHNVTADIHQATYSCSVGNRIALTGSSLSYLTLLDACGPGTMEVLGFCIPCAVGTYQEEYGHTYCHVCRDGFTTRLTGSTSEDHCVLAKVSNGESTKTMLTVVLSTTLSVIGLTVLVAAGVYIYMKRRASPSRIHPKKDEPWMLTDI